MPVAKNSVFLFAKNSVLLFTDYNFGKSAKNGAQIRYILPPSIVICLPQIRYILL
jgi:hypothetical protein